MTSYCSGTKHVFGLTQVPWTTTSVESPWQMPNGCQCGRWFFARWDEYGNPVYEFWARNYV